MDSVDSENWMKNFIRYFFPDLTGEKSIRVDGFSRAIEVRRGLVVCPSCRSTGRELLIGKKRARCPACIIEEKVEPLMRKAKKANTESRRQMLYAEVIRIRRGKDKPRSDDGDKAALARLAQILGGC